MSVNQPALTIRQNILWITLSVIRLVKSLKSYKISFLAEQKANQEAYIRAVDEGERVSLAALLEENAFAFVSEKVLQLSILDPAMGSGHFLVNAANLISNFITEIMNEFNIEGRQETSTSNWRRWVVENCIYGVDLNPLAVELAKLSLWILSMAKNHPLSFLNHHLKCGNSLIGARLDEIGNYPFSTIKKELRQLNLFERDPDFKAAVEEVISKSRLIASKASLRLEDVREKKAWLEEIDQILEGYKTICDVHTSLYFGNNVNEAQYLVMVRGKKFSLARSLNINNRYFHWELEFTEIFLEKDGFDVVIGNPPYIDSEGMVNAGQKDIRDYIAMIFSFTKGNWDIYIAFFEAGLRLLNNSGDLSYITPDKWISKSFGDEFRRNTISIITSILILGRDVFESALVDAIVPSFSKRANQKLLILGYKEGNVFLMNNVDKNILKPPYAFDAVFTNKLDFLIRLDSNPGKLSDISICENACATSDAYKLKPFIQNIQIGSNNGVYFKMTNTGTIDRFISKWGNREMVYLGDRYLYPVVNRKSFLTNFPNSYGNKSMQPKIIIKGLTLLDACLDETGEFIPGKSTLVICSEDLKALKFLLGLINSKLPIYYIKEKYSASSYNTGINFTKDMINNFPIPNLTLEIKNTLISIVDQILTAKRENPKLDTSLLQRDLDQFIYELYGLTDEEVAFIEGKEKSI